MIHLVEGVGDILLRSNFTALLRERGKIVPGSHREGHNVFTVTGRNWLSKIAAWSSLSADTPYTERRVRWIGVGTGSQLEVTTVSQLATPVITTASSYLVPLSTVTFPTATSVRHSRTYGTSDISTTSTPVVVTEAGLFVDVDTTDLAGTEDSAVGGGVDTTLDPTVSTNPPIAYKAFDPITKTQDFTLEIRWDFRF